MSRGERRGFDGGGGESRTGSIGNIKLDHISDTVIRFGLAVRR